MGYKVVSGNTKVNKNRDSIFVKQGYLFSFAIPFVAMVLLCIMNGIFPFGEKSILMSDLSNEYVDYFSLYRNIYLGKDSFIYSFSMGLGGFIFLLMHGGSVLNIIFILFPAIDIQEAILLLTLIRISLCGFTMFCFLSKSVRCNGLDSGYRLIFSCGYALMTFNIAYMPVFVWWDCMILLPLILLGIERFIEDNDPRIYVILLAISIMSDWYFGYMTCIFVVVYYFYYMAISQKIIIIKNEAIRCLRFAGYSFLSVGCSMIILLPIIKYLTSSSYESPNGIDLSFQFNPIQIFRSLLMGSFNTIRPGGLPNIYCGMIPVLIFLVYCVSMRDKRQRNASLIALLFLLLSLMIRPIYLVWHGFDNPDWFEARFSFVITAFILIVAYRALIELKKNEMDKVKFVVVISTFFVISLASLAIVKMENQCGKAAICFVFLLLDAYVLYKFLFINNTKYKKIFLILFFLELICNMYITNQTLQKQESYMQRNEYIRVKENLSTLTQDIKELDDSIYRIEKDYMRRENDAMSAGYMGISAFYSYTYNDLHKSLELLGMTARNKLLRYEGATKITDILMGIKYVISGSNQFADYEVTDSYSNLNAFYNSNYLGLMFAVNKSIADYDILSQSNNPFEKQNQVLSKMSGVNENCFYPLEIDPVLYSVEQSNSDGTISFQRNGNNPYLEYFISVEEDKQYYMDFSPCQGNTDIYVENTPVSNYMGQTNKIVSLCDKDNDGYVVVRANVLDDQLCINQYCFYYLDNQIFSKHVNRLKEINGNCTLNEMHGTRVKFTYDNLNKDELIYVAVPYDDNWKITDNGKAVNAEKILNGFIGIPVGDCTGEISMSYVPDGMYMGVTISIICAIICGVVFWVICRREKKCNDKF